MFKELWLGAHLILAVLCCIISVYFFGYSSKNKELKSLRNYSIGIAIFMMVVGINGFVDLTANYYIYELGLPDMIGTGGIFIKVGRPSYYVILSLLMLSIAILSYQIERYIKGKKRYPLTYIMLICFVISLLAYMGGIIPEEYHVILMYIIYSTQIPFGLIILYWGIFYFILGAKASGTVRRKAIMVGFGLGMVFTGILFDIIYRSAVPGEFILPFICKAVAITGIAFLFAGFKRESL